MELKTQQQLEGLRSGIDKLSLAERVDEKLANDLKDQHRVESTGDDIVSVQVEQLRSDINKLSLSEKIDEQLANSSLRWAVQQNDVEMMEKLLKNGANPNSANEDGSTPLHVMAANPSQYSTMARFFEIIDEKHMNDDAQKRSNETPLRVALKQEYEKIKSLLTECYNPKPQRRYGKIKHRDYSLVDMLFDGKHQLVRLDAQDNAGDTPLHLAVRSRNQKAIDLLLSRGAESAFHNANGQAALPTISIDARPTLNKRAFEYRGDDRFQFNFAITIVAHENPNSKIKCPLRDRRVFELALFVFDSGGIKTDYASLRIFQAEQQPSAQRQQRQQQQQQPKSPPRRITLAARSARCTRNDQSSDHFARARRKRSSAAAAAVPQEEASKCSCDK
ncbi:unnamed protein product [Trichogramma brassicae]|uniref:Uncharacterized protein n=1 Tax=Trichogramma brassicae TaxID=86971 RepID=A0A6H5I6M7_9HYME|nr:unnamed protein product [Trichogramma brassicae]